MRLDPDEALIERDPEETAMTAQFPPYTDAPRPARSEPVWNAVDDETLRELGRLDAGAWPRTCALLAAVGGVALSVLVLMWALGW